MFHKPQDLIKRTPADGINRPEFLKQLVQEFRKTNSAGIKYDWRPNEPIVVLLCIFFTYLESKRQVLANLANFAYDPVNYLHIRTQKVIDLFLEQLASDDNQLIAFAAAGLCNLVNGNNYCIVIEYFVLFIICSSVLHYYFSTKIIGTCRYG